MRAGVSIHSAQLYWFSKTDPYKAEHSTTELFYVDGYYEPFPLIKENLKYPNTLKYGRRVKFLSNDRNFVSRRADIRNQSGISGVSIHSAQLYWFSKTDPYRAEHSTTELFCIDEYY